MTIRTLLLFAAASAALGLSACNGFQAPSVFGLGKEVAATKLTVSASSVGPLTAETPFSREAVAAVLPGYDVEADSRSTEGMSVPALRVSRERRTVMTIFGSGDKVERIHVVDEAIATRRETIGRTFSDNLGDREMPGCAPGIEEASGKVLCQAFDAPNVRLIYTGDWAGPDGELPPPDILAVWTLDSILWVAP